MSLKTHFVHGFELSASLLFTSLLERLTHRSRFCGIALLRVGLKRRPLPVIRMVHMLFFRTLALGFD